MTYLNLIQNLQIWTETYPTLGTFSHGPIPEFGGHSRSHNDYPILNVLLENVSISEPTPGTTPTIQFRIEIVILDILLQDRSNEVYILNNLIQVVRDLYTQAFIYDNLVGTLEAQPGPFYLAENLFGLRLSLTLEQPLDFCV